MGTYGRNPELTAQTYINIIQVGMADSHCGAITLTIPRIYVQEVLTAYRETHRFLIDHAKSPHLVRVTVYTNVTNSDQVS